MRSQPRPARAGTTEDLLTAAALCLFGALLLAGALVWSAGQVAGQLAHGRWPSVALADAAGIAASLPSNLANPAASWPASVQNQLAGSALFYAVLILMVVTVAVALAGAALVFSRVGRGPDPAVERDRAPAWGTRRQVPHLLIRRPEPGRIVLGRLGRRGPLVAAEPRRSVLVVAPTQAGKTSRFVVPGVLRWDGPLVVTSVKSDVLQLTYDERLRRGAVHVFDPTGQTGYPTSKWSPLLACTDYPAAEQVATWLVEAAGDARAGDNARFWESLGAKLLAPLLFAAAHSGGGIRQVSSWVDRRETKEVTELLGYLADVDALDAWAATCAREERQRDSVYATAESILKAFASPSARAATDVTGADHVAGRVIDVRRLVAEGETLYLVAPAHAQARLRPLFEALVQAVLRAAQDAYAASGQPLDPPLLLMLDEAANIAPLRELATYASTGAGQGIQICSVWQDLAQIQSIYGRNAATVVNNHTARVFLPGSADLSTLDQTSRMIGEFERQRTSISVGGDGHRSVSTSSSTTRAAPVEYLRQLPAGSAVVLYGRDPALRLHTTAWFDDPVLRRQVEGSAAADGPADVSPARCPQTAGAGLAGLLGAGPTGADLPTAPTAPEPAMCDQDRLPLAVVPTGPSMLDRLAGVPGSDRYLDVTTGREYTIHHAVDGTPIPVPLEMTEVERDEIDRRSDAFQAELRLLADRPPDGAP
jgi:type IV secretion system protein VirD4